LPPEIAELLGYNVRPPFHGYVDGRHPRKYVDGVASPPGCPPTRPPAPGAPGGRGPLLPSVLSPWRRARIVAGVLAAVAAGIGAAASDSWEASGLVAGVVALGGPSSGRARLGVVGPPLR